jgi:pyruvate dehydrogenase complex dehydrogenase (E1) component
MTQHSPFEDIDPVETQEWLESIDSVMRAQGPERAHFLLEKLVDFTRRSGAYLPFKPNTAYLNTISRAQEPDYPGDRSLERRNEAYIRWNAMAMVVQANRATSEYGGHIASYASAATLYEVGFNHFWRARSDKHPGDMIFMQGHSSPGVYARPARGRRRRLVVLPASLADAGFLAVPDRLDGPGTDDGDFSSTLPALSGAPRHRAPIRPQGMGVSRRRRDG